MSEGVLERLVAGFGAELDQLNRYYSPTHPKPDVVATLPLPQFLNHPLGVHKKVVCTPLETEMAADTRKKIQELGVL